MKKTVLYCIITFLVGSLAGALAVFYYLFDLREEAYLLNLVWITIFAGILGGIVNYFFNESEVFSVIDCAKSIVFGILAAALVPLFLNMLSSDLVTDIRGSDKIAADPYKYFIFLGFCLIAAVSSRSFIQNLSDRILNEVKKAKATSELAKEKTEKLEKSVTPIIDKETEPDNLPPEVGAEIAEALPGQEVQLGDTKLKVLTALTTPPYTFRSKSGIVKESNLSGEEVDRLLFDLTEKDYVRQREGKNGARWSITQTGRAAVLRLTSTD